MHKIHLITYNRLIALYLHRSQDNAAGHTNVSPRLWPNLTPLSCSDNTPKTNTNKLLCNLTHMLGN